MHGHFRFNPDKFGGPCLQGHEKQDGKLWLIQTLEHLVGMALIVLSNRPTVYAVIISSNSAA